MKKYILIFSLCAIFFGGTSILGFENNVQIKNSQTALVVNSCNSQAPASGGSKFCSKRRSRRRGAYSESHLSEIAGHFIAEVVCYWVAFVVGSFVGLSAGQGVALLILAA